MHALRPHRLLFRLAGLVAVVGLATVASSWRERPPCADCNVVLISMDTVRADHLGAYGYARDTSPSVDRFARHAAVFDDAISQSAWTLPAHGSMMTGLHPGRLGVSDYAAKRLLPEVPTLAEHFRSAGYATAGFTGGGFVASRFGFSRGFEVYTTGGPRFEHNVEQALSWLEDKRKFFLFLHGYDAHRPYYSRPEDKAAVGLATAEPALRLDYCRPADPTKPEDLDVVIQYYDASIRHGDREVGRFLDALEARGLSGRTIVLITSDHGEEFFEHGNCDHVRFLYREVVHVPFLLRVPGHASAGKRFADLIPASTSVPRTLLELVGIDASAFPGESLMSTLEGEPAPFAAVYSETDSERGDFASRGATIAMTTRDRKLVSYLDEGTDEGFDTIHDVGEQVVLPRGDRVCREIETLAQWKRSLEPLPPPQGRKQNEPEKLPADVRERLESLGYVDRAP